MENTELVKTIEEMVNKTVTLGGLFDKLHPEQNAGDSIRQTAETFKNHLQTLTGRVVAAETELAQVKAQFAAPSKLKLEAIKQAAMKEYLDSVEILANQRVMKAYDNWYFELATHSDRLLGILVKTKSNDDVNIEDEIFITDSMLEARKNS